MSVVTTSSNHRKNLGAIKVTSILFDDNNATTASLLTSYEEWSLNINVSDHLTAPFATRLKIVRTGNQCNLFVGGFLGTFTGTATNVITVVPVGTIPTRFRPDPDFGSPSINIPLYCDGSLGGVTGFGSVDSNGDIQVTLTGKPGSPVSAGGTPPNFNGGVGSLNWTITYPCQLLVG